MLLLLLAGVTAAWAATVECGEQLVRLLAYPPGPAWKLNTDLEDPPSYLATGDSPVGSLEATTLAEISTVDKA